MIFVLLFGWMAIIVLMNFALAGMGNLRRCFNLSMIAVAIGIVIAIVHTP